MNIEFGYDEVQKAKLTSQLGIGNELEDIWFNEEYLQGKEKAEKVAKCEQKEVRTNKENPNKANQCETNQLKPCKVSMFL